MLQRFQISRVSRRSVSLLILGSILMLFPALVRAQDGNAGAGPAAAAQEEDCKSIQELVDVKEIQKALICQNLAILKDSHSLLTARLTSLNLLLAALEAGTFDEQDKLFAYLKDQILDPNEEIKFKIQAIKVLPGIALTIKDESKESYKNLVAAMMNFLLTTSPQYHHSWIVTDALNDGLQKLPVSITPVSEIKTATSTLNRRGYWEISQALKQIVLDGSLDTQVRYNAISALTTKGTAFKTDLEDTTKKAGVDQTSFYMINLRLNEIITDPKAKGLPSTIMNKATLALNDFLKVKLP